MDIKKLDAVIALDEQEVEIVIYQKDGTPYLAPDGKTPCTITVVGEESQRVRDAKRATQRRILHQRTARIGPEEIERNRIFEAAAAVTRWSGWTAGSDAPAACAQENVRELLRVPHILTQVEQGVSGHADFFKQQSGS
ncbi:MAG: hypothetical protein ABIH03_07900 [Pseudomonadota bacterium]